MDLAAKWYFLGLFYLLIAGGMLHAARQMRRAATTPAEGAISQKALRVAVLCFIGMPLICVLAPSLFAYVDAEAPRLAVIQGPLLIVALLGLLPMGLPLLRGGPVSYE